MTFKQIKEEVARGYGENCNKTFIIRQYKKISVVLTYLFQFSNLSPNQISFLVIIIGFIAGFIFSKGFMLSGILVMHLWFIVDCVDGEIARLKKRTSITGEYFDHLIHYLNHPTFFIGISFGLYSIVKWEAIIVFGFIAAIFDLIDRASADTFFMVYYKNLIKNKCYHIETGYKSIKLTLLNLIKINVRFPHTMYNFTISIFLDELLNLFIQDKFFITSILLIIYGSIFPLFVLVGKFKKVVDFEIDKKIQDELSKEAHR